MNNSFRIGYIVDPDKLFNVELIPDFRDKFQPADLEAFWEDYWEKWLQEIQKFEFWTAYDESDASIFDDDNLLSGEELDAVLREEFDMDEKFDASLFWGDFDDEKLPF